MLRPLSTLLVGWRDLQRFTPKLTFSLDRGKYRVRTAESWKDLEPVLRLRHDVFLAEGLSQRHPWGLETEPLDAAADHLIVEERDTGTIAGSYRLLSSCVSARFYSETEFSILTFLARPGVKLELSRACIRREFRNGAVIQMLWRGVLHYARAINASWLFGCASVPATEMETALRLYRHFRETGAADASMQVRPLRRYTVPGLVARLRKRDARAPAKEEGGDPTALLPPLLEAYLRAGARVHGVPALDRAFRCLDFFTTLKLDGLGVGYAKRYADAATKAGHA